MLLLQTYNQAKAAHQSLLTATCLVPAHDLAKIRSLLHNWSLAHTLKKNQYQIIKHFSDSPPVTELGGTDLFVFVDTPPHNTHYHPLPEHILGDKKPRMTFQGKVSGVKAIIGADTFAGGFGYIHPSIVQANRLHTRPCRVHIRLGQENHETESTEECLVHLSVGPYECKAWLLVLSIPEPYDVLLGDEWLETHKARLLYDKNMMEIITTKRRFSIKTISTPPPVSYTQSHPVQHESRMLTYLQAKRAFRKNYTTMLCFIQKESESEEEFISDPDVSSEHLEQLNALKSKYPHLFGDALYQEAPVRSDMPEVIPITLGSRIPNRPLYRYSPIEQAEIEKQVHKMLEQKLIEPSTSPYGDPVLLVKKPDGSWRFCVDYRALNAITEKNGHALPRIDDLLGKIQGAKYFTSMDLLQGFYQLPLRESDRPKTAFKTTFGHFQFRVVSMGLSNAPSVFQRVMNQIFSETIK